MPAGTFLVGIGVFVGSGIAPPTTILWAAVGAMAGTSASYTCGLWFGPRVRQMKLVKNRVDLMDRAEALFLRFGFASILLGYFSGPLRAPVASIAAMAGMSRARFEISNAISALLWATYSVGLGAIPGMMIDPNSPWLLVAPWLVPLIVIGVSATVLQLRRMKRTSR